MFGRTKTEPRHTEDETRVHPTSYDDGSHDTAHHAVVRDDDVVLDPEQRRRDRFGGMNWGAGFFGWLVAVAVSVLLTAVLGAVGVGTSADEELLPAASTTELGAAAILTLVAVLMVGYYAGGYVAGRMSRYDGVRQGLGVWVVGLVMTLLAVAAGSFLGTEYDVLSRIELPNVPLSTDTMTTGGLVLAALMLLGTLVAALVGGGVGRRYHARVDRAGS